MNNFLQKPKKWKMHKVNVLEKFQHVTAHWTPKIAGELNGQQVKLVKFEGPFTWHHHENEDRARRCCRRYFTQRHV